MTLAPGFHPGVSHEDYHADPAPISLSASIAHTLVSKSPAHAYHAHPRLGAGERKAATREMDRGSLIGMLLLGTGPTIVPVDADDWRTKAAKEVRDAAREKGWLAVLKGDLDEAVALAQRLKDKLRVRGVEFTGQSEVTVVWNDDGVLCRGRLDHWREDIATIFDVKFYASAQPEAFSRAMVTNGLDIQRAAYVRAVEYLRPDLAGRVKFVDIVIESSAPHPITLIECAGSMRELGERRWKRARDLWAQCMETGAWGEYATGTAFAEAPPWALADDMGKQMAAMPEGGSPGVTF